MQAYAKSPHSSESIRLFRWMLADRRLAPDKYTFTFVLTSCARQPASIIGTEVHALVVQSGFLSDIYVGNALVNFYSVFRMIDSARKVFDEMLSKDVVTWTSLIRGYTNNNDMETALKLFNWMPHPNDVTWAVMIDGYVEVEKYSDAIRLFCNMLQCAKVRPNEAVLVCVLSACANLGALDQGRWIHTYIDRSKFPSSANISTALIDMYSKCGQVLCAKQVFSSMYRRDVLTWTSMINGLAMYGLGIDALRLFHQMVVEGIKPDNITLLGVLNGCSHSGLVDEGCCIFYGMEHLWGIVPKIEHYGCLVDLLGRAGKVEKAVAIVIKMPIEPDIIIWRALLSACRVHGKVELGKSIADHISQLYQHSQEGGYVLLSNMYACAGRWDEAANARKKLSEGSTPGCSWIEVDGMVHEFLASDQLHPQILEIQKNLKEVIREAVLRGGYITNANHVLFDLSEEERDHAVCWHSEKLAVSFGLMSMEPGCSIRIMKNLRICEDCHALMKAISIVFAREIVVRDRSRFHTFSGGKCSCMDYW